MDKYNERARAFVEFVGMSPLTAEPPEKLASALAAELRAVAAEARADAERQRDTLRAALVQAREDMAGWTKYVPEYYCTKHNLSADLAAIDKALEASNE